MEAKRELEPKSEMSRKKEIDFWWFWRHDQELELDIPMLEGSFSRMVTTSLICYYSHFLICWFLDVLWYLDVHIGDHISSYWWVVGYGLDVASFFFLLSISLGLNMNVEIYVWYLMFGNFLISWQFYHNLILWQFFYISFLLCVFLFAFNL